MSLFVETLAARPFPARNVVVVLRAAAEVDRVVDAVEPVRDEPVEIGAVSPGERPWNADQSCPGAPALSAMFPSTRTGPRCERVCRHGVRAMPATIAVATSRTVSRRRLPARLIVRTTLSVPLVDGPPPARHAVWSPGSDVIRAWRHLNTPNEWKGSTKVWSRPPCRSWSGFRTRHASRRAVRCCAGGTSRARSVKTGETPSFGVTESGGEGLPQRP